MALKQKGPEVLMCLFSHIIQFLSTEYANTKTHTQHLFKVNSAGKFLIKKKPKCIL